ncbi:MAG TPA: AAA family ATPase [Candidatus Limnocylindrales bacterium]|nr:AAA family ATPase [Candidatus Limnocylindrales bacterium]
MHPPFVGRRRELEALLTLRQRAHAARRPAVAIVIGEPGSGKTRLMAEALGAAAPGRVIRAVGFEPTQTIPFAAVGDFLRALTQVPRHGTALERLVFGEQDEPTRDRLRIFEAAHRALGGLGTVTLAVDDLQWVDESSVALIHYLIRAADAARQPFVVIAASRPSPTAASLLSSIEAEVLEGSPGSIHLGPLAVEEGARLVRSIDPRIEATAAEELWHRAQGSPFWLEALARGRADGDLDRSHLIADRLRALASDAGALLAALSIAARPFSADEMASVMEWPIERVRDAVRELAARGLTVETAGSLRLAHDLIRESAHYALPEARRTTLHTRIAEVIELSADDDLQLLAEALEHRASAGLPSAALALQLLTSPRRRLLGRRHLQLIASISDGLASGTPAQVEFDRGLAELAAVLGEHDLAEERWTRVSAGTGNPTQRQLAELEAARASYHLGCASDAHRHLDHARLAATPTAETAVRLDALTAEVKLWLDHETAAGSEMARRSLTTAEAVVAAAGGLELVEPGLRGAFLAALQAAGDAALQEDRPDEIARISELGVLVAGTLDPESHVAALIRAGFGLQPLGRVGESAGHYRQAWDLARRAVLPTAMVEAGHGLARALRALGRLSDAHAIGVETAELEGRLGNPPRGWGNARVILHSIELSLGDPTRALSALTQDAADESDPHFRIGIHQRIAAWLARTTGAAASVQIERELAAARAAAAEARCPRCNAELEVTTAEILARIGRWEDAERALAEWEAQRTATYPGSERWRLAATAATASARGDTARAVRALQQLDRDLSQGGMLEELIWVRLDVGMAYAASDRQAAVAALTSAAAIAEEIGARSQLRLVAQALRRLGVRAWRRGPSGRGRRPTGRRLLDGDVFAELTTREREVVGLVAEGMSNREIAEALSVSPKTVERHLTNVLAKVGLRNRTELATQAHSVVVRDFPDE